MKTPWFLKIFFSRNLFIYFLSAIILRVSLAPFTAQPSDIAIYYEFFLANPVFDYKFILNPILIIHYFFHNVYNLINFFIKIETITIINLSDILKVLYIHRTGINVITDPLYNFIFKIPLIFSDILICIFFYYIMNIKNKKENINLLKSYLFNPFLILMSSVFGSTEIYISLVFIIMYFLYINNKKVYLLFLSLISILVNIMAILISPIIIYKLKLKKEIIIIYISISILIFLSKLYIYTDGFKVLDWGYGGLSIIQLLFYSLMILRLPLKILNDYILYFNILTLLFGIFCIIYFWGHRIKRIIVNNSLLRIVLIIYLPLFIFQFKVYPQYLLLLYPFFILIEYLDKNEKYDTKLIMYMVIVFTVINVGPTLFIMPTLSYFLNKFPYIQSILVNVQIIMDRQFYIERIAFICAIIIIFMYKTYSLMKRLVFFNDIII